MGKFSRAYQNDVFSVTSNPHPVSVSPHFSFRCLRGGGVALCGISEDNRLVVFGRVYGSGAEKGERYVVAQIGLDSSEIDQRRVDAYRNLRKYEDVKLVKPGDEIKVFGRGKVYQT